MLPWLVSLFAFEAVGQMARVKSFSRYPGYNGTLAISGSISIATGTGGKGTAPYDFTTQVTGAVADGVHGIHVHSGVSCAKASLVGGHFWEPFPSVDPWNSVNGTANSSGAIDVTSGVNLGYNMDMFIGHAMVIHDPQGGRVACGIIEDVSTNRTVSFESATLEKYPGYNGSLNVSGTVEVWDLDATTEIVNFRLKGLEANATGGAHIHVGTTCANSSSHYWTPTTNPDPWGVNTVYTSNGQGVAEGSFMVSSGYQLSANKGHAVVIHDSTGARIACGLLGVLPVPCPSSEIKAVFAACKATDFNSTTCTRECYSNLTTMITAFEAVNLTLSEAQGCIDSTESSSPWVDGDVEALKARLNFEGVALCKTPAIPSSARSASLLASLLVVGVSALLM